MGDGGDRERRSMSFLSVFGYDLFSGAFSLAMVVCTGLFVLRTLSFDKGKFRGGGIVLAAVWIVMEAGAAALLYKAGLLRYYFVSILMEYVLLIGNALCIGVLFRERFRRCWGIVLFAGIAAESSVMMVFILTSERPYDLSIGEERIRYLLSNYILGPAAILLILFLLHQLKVGDAYRRWLEHRDVWNWGMLCLSAYPVLIYSMMALFTYGGMSRNSSMSIAYLVLIAALIVFHYKGREEWQRKEAAAQSLIVQQQEAYIRTLEGMQKEMRRFRHDYKNMMSGMYLTAKEGELTEAMDYIRELTEDFDSQIGGQIRQMSHLGNVCMTEVRGLLLAKISQMQKEGTACELEVMRPFRETGCRTTDLCRCLGILIDNAMDEVRGKEDARVHIMISCQEGYTTFRVKNRLYHEVDVHRIWQQGYSTRGAERGIGLASYRKILDGYGNVLPATAVEEGYFVQEFKVEERNAG